VEAKKACEAKKKAKADRLKQLTAATQAAGVRPAPDADEDDTQCGYPTCGLYWSKAQATPGLEVEKWRGCTACSLWLCALHAHLIDAHQKMCKAHQRGLEEARK
jgi:hypothetical protein